MKILLATLLLIPTLAAFDTPLSEEAVREAYFLGQRHDESISKALEKYTQWFPIPDSGPQIASVTCLTPFAQAIILSSNHAGNYSAQQAQIDHRHQPETVQVQVAIRFTDTYPALIASGSTSTRNHPPSLISRPSDFWRDFSVSVYDGDKLLDPSDSQGRPDFTCSDAGCVLIGATILLDFPAAAFAKQDATVQIDPPEGDQLVTTFDLSQVR